MTEIETCPKCKKKGISPDYTFTWKYATDSGMTNGHGECNLCGFKFK